jgi:sugar phosphate isomerase/epimerase
VNEKYLIQTQGFRNVTDNGETVGFEVQIKIAYYRGISLSIIGDLELVVDGETFRDDRLRFTAGNRSFTTDELAREERARWEFGQRGTLKALKPGGLAPGAHSLTLRQTISPAYIPPPGFVAEASKTLTLCPEQEARPHSQVALGVSLYSYQEEYYTGAMTLEDCVAEVAAIGADGIQLIPEQMMPGYPDPSPEWLEAWRRMIDVYGLRPTLMDTFVDVTCGGHRTMSVEEGVERLVEQMKLAKQLGFSVIRPTTGPVPDAAPELIRACLSHAESLDVRVAPEIHAPVRVGGPLTTSYLEMIQETGTEHLGFTLDLGIFCTRLPPALIGHARRQGAQPHIVDYIDRAFREGRPNQEIMAKVEEMGGGPGDRYLAMRSRGFGPPSNRPEELADILPHVMNVHGKFYEITPEGEEESIPYAAVMKALVEGGYEGYVDSEYEGQRLTQDAFDTDSCEQIRRHQLLMRRCLEPVRVPASAATP